MQNLPNDCARHAHDFTLGTSRKFLGLTCTTLSRPYNPLVAPHTRRTSVTNRQTMATWDASVVKVHQFNLISHVLLSQTDCPFQTQLRLTAQRLGQLQERKDSQGQSTRKDIAHLLQRGNIGLARVKAQNLIHEDSVADLLEALEIHIGLLVEHFTEIEQKYVCNVHNIVWT